MTGSAGRLLRFGMGLAVVVIAGWVLSLRAARPALEGIPSDWTHRHVIFSQPATIEQAQLISADPRYWHEWYERNTARRLHPDGDELSYPLAARRVRATVKSPLRSDWSMNMGTGASAGAGNFPAKYSFRTSSANCGTSATPDYIVFSSGLSGSATQASIVAYDNLYAAGCSGTVPTVYWAYNTGARILTSPVISGDGTQIAFVQTTGTAASLVLLKWAAGTGSVGSPAAPTSVLPSGYGSCTAPCMTEVALHNGSGGTDDDATSSAFPDYTHDVIWVGGATGWLHQITGVFRGVPTEVTTGGFPVQVNAGVALSSPVYDIGSGNVFVSDRGGFLYRVTSTAGVTVSGRVDYGVGLMAGPIVDSTAGIVYVFSSNDNSTSCAGATPCASVYAFKRTFNTGATGQSRLKVGKSSATPNELYEAAFDNAYWTSKTATGNLYVCGATASTPTLYWAAVSAGTFGGAFPISTLTAAGTTPACSPVTYILNPNGIGNSVERVFFGVQNNGRPTACAGGGCAMSFVASQWQAATSYALGQEIITRSTGANTLYINVAIVAGTSGATAPAWPNTTGTTTPDGGIAWLNQGPTTVIPLAAWRRNHAYTTVGARIVDSNGNVEIVSVAGTSGASAPAWNTTPGLTTVDGTVLWSNGGALPNAALPANGGASGIIIDNVVPSGTMAGASEVYFSILGSQTCTTSGGTGGCAVQASQSALQ
jgi:hypothetical protein